MPKVLNHRFRILSITPWFRPIKMTFKYKMLSNSLSVKVVLSIGMDVTFNNVIMELAETLNTLYYVYSDLELSQNGNYVIKSCTM